MYTHDRGSKDVILDELSSILLYLKMSLMEIFKNNNNVSGRQTQRKTADI